MVYWGDGRIVCINEQWKIRDYIRCNLETALLEAGIKTNLWLPLESGWVCSCKKDEGFDVNCLTCYGTGWIGGYRRYGYSYADCAYDFGYYFSSTVTEKELAAVYNVAEIEVVTKLKPYRLGLKDGVLTGVITWKVPFYDTAVLDYDLRSFIRDSSVGASSVTVEYSWDTITWFPITAIVGTPSQTSALNVRVTLTRASAGVRSPLFEILRIRGKVLRDDWILMSRSRNVQDMTFEKNGVVDLEGRLILWTIQDFDLRPHGSERQRGPMIELLQSPFIGGRYELFNINPSFWRDEEFRQVMEARVISRDREIYWKIF